MSSFGDAPLAIAVLVVGLAGCKQSETVSEVFVAESKRLQTLTVPSDARLLELGDPKQESLNSVGQEWRVAATATWTEYAASVSEALEPGYHCSAAASQGLLCSRSTHGDYFLLSLTPEPDVSELVVRARFGALPN